MSADLPTKDRRSVKISGEDAQALRRLALSLGFENPRQHRTGNTSEMLRRLAERYRSDPDAVTLGLRQALGTVDCGHPDAVHATRG